MWIRGVVGRANRGGLNQLIILVGLGGFVLGVYVLVVLGGGTLIGRTDSPNLLLSVSATAAVALLFAPVQRVLERAATRMGLGHAATPPYEVLSRFSETVTQVSSTDALPARMARLLAQGTRAEWAQVWLIAADRLTLAATWPTDAVGDDDPPFPQGDGRDATGAGRRALTVSHDGQVLGVLRLQERSSLALTPVEERLFRGLAAQAGLVLTRIGLRAELELRHSELQARAGELRASRERLIEMQDSERRRLERDIHDGAQQHLVALAVHLRLAQTIAIRSPDRLAGVLAEQADAARDAIETLLSLARGIYPRLLSVEGLEPALRAGVAASAIPVTVESLGVGRLPAAVEAALYFCCMEAVQNAAKHSDAEAISVEVSEDHDQWRLTVIDDGTGFDQASVHADDAAGGLMNMRDRMDSVGGTVTLTSRSGLGTTVAAAVPRVADRDWSNPLVPALRAGR